MDDYSRMFQKNRQWADKMIAADPGYFTRREMTQEPHTLFIGCSDSRVPTNALTQTEPGELFVHRNIANQIFSSDLNALSVIQYAVDVLDVKHVVVCGHYRCGGVKAAMTDEHFGLVDYWIGNLRALRDRCVDELNELPDDTARTDRLVELNVIQQIYQLTLNSTIRGAWERGRRPVLHGVVYGLGDGLMHELITSVDGSDVARSLLPQLGGTLPESPARRKHLGTTAEHAVSAGASA